jgi:hypothetical protein
MKTLELKLVTAYPRYSEILKIPSSPLYQMLQITH